MPDISPAPWHVVGDTLGWTVADGERFIASFHRKEEAEACANAHNARDVMRRRPGWHVEWESDGTYVVCKQVGFPVFKSGSLELFVNADADLALIEADKWMTGQERANDANR